MERQGKVAAGHLALFASLYALQGVVVASFNFNQLYMMAGGGPGAQAADVQSPALVRVLGGALFARLASSLGASDEPADRRAFAITGGFVLLAWPTVRVLGRPPRATARDA